MSTTRHYGVDILEDGRLVWGWGGSARTRRAAITTALRRYLAAYPDGHATHAKVFTVSRGTATIKLDPALVSKCRGWEASS